MSDTQKYINDDQYKRSLVNLRKVVETKPLIFVDDETPGNKTTECSWGLCSKSKDIWDDKEMHFSYIKLDSGDSGPKYRGKCHACPHDRDIGNPKHNPMGCFYRCRVFKPDHEPRPTKEKTLQVIDILIGMSE